MPLVGDLHIILPLNLWAVSDRINPGTDRHRLLVSRLSGERSPLRRHTVCNDTKKKLSSRAMITYWIPINAFLILVFAVTSARADDLLTLDNAVAKVGIDRERGAAITWLSSAAYPKNIVNLADPGRLIQQSYYAGKSRDRMADGQSESWSPWPWNPIQGGGVGSWARTSEFKKIEDGAALFSETIPKLWDMPNEEASARMRQWTAFEPAMPDVVVVRCELACYRDASDPWGPAAMRPQEIPACYFTRNFNLMKSYLGDGKWKIESQKPGPPWGRTNPPQDAMAFFEPGGQGVAVYCPCSRGHWNFGPHAGGNSDDPLAGPCMHVAPLDRVKLGPDSIYRYRYWLIVGDEASIAKRLDRLITKYSQEEAKLAGPESDIKKTSSNLSSLMEKPSSSGDRKPRR
jgi:hypothetical protein